MKNRTKEEAAEYQRQWRAAHPDYAKNLYRKRLGLPLDVGRLYRGKPVMTEDERRARMSERSRISNAKARQYVRAAKERPCTDCGVEYPFYVMQFDHVRGEKLFNLSNPRARTLDAVQRELDKCEVVCANCHAARSYKRLDL